MSLQQSESRRIGRVGWFAVGILVASLAFLVLMVAGDIFKAIGSEAQADTHSPALVIEGR